MMMVFVMGMFIHGFSFPSVLKQSWRSGSSVSGRSSNHLDVAGL
jgi:hypothetical protein